jgi:hypothetical protein
MISSAANDLNWTWVFSGDGTQRINTLLQCPQGYESEILLENNNINTSLHFSFKARWDFITHSILIVLLFAFEWINSILFFFIFRRGVRQSLPIVLYLVHSI